MHTICCVHLASSLEKASTSVEMSPTVCSQHLGRDMITQCETRAQGRKVVRNGPVSFRQVYVQVFWKEIEIGDRLCLSQWFPRLTRAAGVCMLAVACPHLLECLLRLDVSKSDTAVVAMIIAQGTMSG